MDLIPSPRFERRLRRFDRGTRERVYQKWSNLSGLFTEEWVPRPVTALVE